MSLISRAKRKYKKDGLVPLVKSGSNYAVAKILNIFRKGPTKEEQHNVFKQDYELSSYINQGTDETSYWIESVFFQKSKQGADSSVLELGCNVGRHLNAFHKRGYDNLTGVDINKEVFDEMEKQYPKLANELTFHQGSFESVLPEIDQKFDVIYSVAVLMHVSDESSHIFDEIYTSCNDMLITIEAENSGPEAYSKNVVYRNYKEIFETRGLSQIFEYKVNQGNRILGDNLDNRYVARVFRKPS